MNTEKKFQSGQILLVTIMLIATALTVALATAFTSKTNTKTTKLEEDSQKALAAAQAGIETAVRQGTVTDLSTIPGLSGITGSAVVTETNSLTNFISPLLQKDESYTFYLADYPSFINPQTGTISVYYGTQGVTCDNIALELTLIYGTSPNYSIKRFIADKAGRLTSQTDNIYYSLFSGGNLQNTAFNCRTDPAQVNLTNSFANPKILIVKALFYPTKLGFEGSATLKTQGKTIFSDAKTSIGVDKQIQLFQSYPQISSDFFVTSF